MRAWAAETGYGPRRDDWEAKPRRGQIVNAKWAAERERWPSAAEVASVVRWSAAILAAGVRRPSDMPRRDWTPRKAA